MPGALCRCGTPGQRRRTPQARRAPEAGCRAWAGGAEGAACAAGACGDDVSARQLQAELLPELCCHAAAAQGPARHRCWLLPAACRQYAAAPGAACGTRGHLSW